MRIMKGLAALFAGIVLTAGGGGGGGAGAPPFGGGGTQPPPTSTAATIEVLTSNNSVGTGGDTVTISAIVKDVNNNSLPSTAVSFSTDTGTLTEVTATTNAAGVASAKLSAGADKTNRSATISVTSGTAAGSVVVAISGTRLTVSGPTTLPLGGSANLTATATDSTGNAIANIPLTIASSLGNGLSTSAASTDANGQLSVGYTATASGSDTVTFSGGGASASVVLTISGEDFAFISPAASTQVLVGAQQQVQVRFRQGGVPQAGRTVAFAATVGALTATSAVTDANGVAGVSVSSTFAGASIVTASLQGISALATLPLQFIATVPDTIVLQVSPTAIGPNAGGSSTNQTTATARVTDAGDNPVTGVTVNFSQVADPSGGQLQQASAVTDTNGQAVVKYIAGPNSTSSGGVRLRATVASNAAIFSEASLTVNQASLFIALGTGNVIQNLDEQTYKKDWTVYVTDANGVAVSGVTITLRVLPLSYKKGDLVFNGDAWVYRSNVITCPNEDVDYDGFIDLSPQPEDVNSSQTLEPGNVISVSPGTLVTSSSGRATLSLIYAESYVPWVDVRLEVTAIVAGTESSTSSSFTVIGLADDFTDETVPPAGRISPFGTNLSCAVAN